VPDAWPELEFLKVRSTSWKVTLTTSLKVIFAISSLWVTSETYYCLFLLLMMPVDAAAGVAASQERRSWDS
jgi:hypothetical protein